MRRTVIAALSVLILSLTLCVAGVTAVNRAADELQGLRLTVERDARLGNVAAARRGMRDIEGRFARWEGPLKLIVSHDALDEVRLAVADAAICLEQGRREDFFRASAAAGIAIERIRSEEAVRWENVW